MLTIIIAMVTLAVMTVMVIVAFLSMIVVIVVLVSVGVGGLISFLDVGVSVFYVQQLIDGHQPLAI